MKAFLNDGQGLGTDHSTVTNEYKTVAAMFKHAVKPFMRSHGDYCKAEIFYNWDNRYGTPSKIMVYTNENGQILAECLPAIN